MLVHNFLEKSAEKYPDRKAVWCKDEWMTFSEIERKSNKMANFLVQIGIKKGERIALLYENSFQYVIAYYAIVYCCIADACWLLDPSKKRYFTVKNT